MKLVASSAQYLPQGKSLEGVYTHIEKAARTCYKSENLINENSAKTLVNRLINNKHYAMLEHGTIYLHRSDSLKEYNTPTDVFYNKYLNNPYSKALKITITSIPSEQSVVDVYVTTNYRVLVENNWLEDLKYWCEPTVYHERRYTLKLITDRGVMAEVTRHRAFSFGIESTRYCNYNSNKFGRELIFIEPTWLNEYNKPTLLHHLEECEKLYLNLTDGVKQIGVVTEPLDRSYTAQEARQVLPNALKTEICMTGFASDWRFFFDLRYYGETGRPHPDMESLASKAREEFIKAGLWDNIIQYSPKFDRNDTDR